ncbi:MAG: FAD-binding protein [Chitinophagaceae bacterium]|nr:FAD-binding protein [Chitinophagaceae bacterium]
MVQEISLELLPEQYASIDIIKACIQSQLNMPPHSILQYRILRKSIDARGRSIKILLKLQVAIGQSSLPAWPYTFQGSNVSLQTAVHIIGAGPAGIFAALRCIELGLKPILFERGKDVRSRRRDLAILNKEGILNEESNYCFGEGGAGTYSDGKLYTRSNKRGDIQKVLSWFHDFGADENILYEAHPHIGTNKLPHIIESMREMIISCGGEIHFNTKLTNLVATSTHIKELVFNQQIRIPAKHVILATGHSANDIYELLFQHKILLEAKPFALGVRVEHPQALVDEIQYHGKARNNVLPPASYSLVEQVNGRGVFSFCMCPGGIIAPASTHQGALVVNGWSPSKRNNPFANSGMVVSVQPQDYLNDTALGGLLFQRQIEEKAFKFGGGRFVAPAQRLTDFVQQKNSSTLPACSYIPGVTSSNLHAIFPKDISRSLAQGFELFGKKMKGFLTQEAVVVATESRTSSPVKIPRDKDNLHHLQLENLYPCAEGAGYAGGIVSAAMDGMRIVDKIKASISS